MHPPVASPRLDGAVRTHRMTPALLLAMSLHASAGPERAAQSEWLEEPRTSGSLMGGTLFVAMRLWRSISIGDGDRCSLQPTCSAYAVRAVRRDGIWGAVLAFDRLQRDGIADEYELSDDGRYRLDPVEDHLHAVDLLLTGRTCREQRRAGAAACL